MALRDRFRDQKTTRNRKKTILASIGTELFRASISVKPVSIMKTDLLFVSKQPRFLFVAICEGAVALVSMPCLSISVRSSASVNFFGGDVLDLVFVIFFMSTFCPRYTHLRWATIFAEKSRDLQDDILDYAGINTEPMDIFELFQSQALDSNVNRKRLMDIWRA